MSLHRYSESNAPAAEIATVTVMLILTAIFAFFKTAAVSVEFDIGREIEPPLIPEGPIIIAEPRRSQPSAIKITAMNELEEEEFGDDEPLVNYFEDFENSPAPPIVFTGIKDIAEEDVIQYINVQEKPFLPESEIKKLRDALSANFPELARKSGTEGKVRLSFVCSADGVPENIDVIYERPKDMGFGEAAVRSLMSVRFTPGYQNDRAVAVRMVYPMTFSLLK